MNFMTFNKAICKALHWVREIPNVDTDWRKEGSGKPLHCSLPIPKGAVKKGRERLIVGECGNRTKHNGFQL